MKAVFLGNRQAGCIGLLVLAAAGLEVQAAITDDTNILEIATILQIPTFSSIIHPEVEGLLRQSDILVCVHGKEIVPKALLELTRLGGINVHPCLYRYKGANPVERFLRDGCVKASVGVHNMSDRIDEGKVVVEEFVEINAKKSVEEVYNQLYPLYIIALFKALVNLQYKEYKDCEK